MSVLILALLAIMLIVTAAETLSTPAGLQFLAENGKKSGVVTTKSGLQYKVLQASSDPHAISPNSTSKCHVHYRGTTIEGMEFDSSYKRHKPTIFAPNDVIRGWAEALLVMREGDKWQVFIPAELAYGKRSMGEHIAPGSVLIFEMELVKVEIDDGAFSAVARLLPKFVRDLPFGVWIFVLYFGYQLIGPDNTKDGAAANAKRVALSAVSGSEYNEEVFLDIQIGDAAPEKLTFELFNAHAPRTTSNFSHLCRGDLGAGTMGKPLAFKGSEFHRIIPGFMAQGGDFTHGTGVGGESIYGAKFDDEWTNGVIGHTEPYLLSMANAGKNTNGSQFFITAGVCQWLDGNHVVFGKLLTGKSTMEKVMRVGSQSGTASQKVAIVNCGVVKEGKPIPAPAPAPAAASTEAAAAAAAASSDNRATTEQTKKNN